MTTQRLQASDKRLVLAAVLIIAASAWYTWLNYEAAFPQASIDLRYSRDQITGMAERILRDRGFSTTGFRNLTLFDSDDDARLFLEREVGLQEANRLMQREVSVWRWRTRWFRPPEKEEMVVLLSPDGRMVGFEHTIAEEAPGERLAMDEARALASEFLRRQTSTPQRLMEERLQERPNRYDYVFTWEQEGFRVQDATYRRSVVIQGREVGSYAEELHVPEQWKRDFAALRSKNDLYTQIAQAFYVPLMLAAIVVLIQSMRRRQIPWRSLIWISGAIGALMVINEWNGLAFFIDRMPTSSTYQESLTIGLLQGVGAGVGVFFYVILAAAAGEPLYRSSQPSHLSLPAAFSARGIRTREFFRSSIVGYAFAAAHIAFVVAFYLIGRKFGVWSPQDVRYSDLLSTWLPWIYPLTISVLASCSEEFWFRLLAIPLLGRFLRARWLIVVIPAFVWGFLHANYPQQPGYIRGIEVGVIGVAAGYIMLRYGILATLIWHYTVDAVLIGTFLLQAGSWYFRLSGIVVAGAVLFPLIVSLVQYRRRGGFLADDSLSNAEAQKQVSPEVEAAPSEAPAEPLAPRWPVRTLYASAALAIVIGLLCTPVRFGNFLEVRLSRTEAERIADRGMEQRQLPPDSWRHIAQFLPNLSAADFEYLRRVAGPQVANEVVRDRTITGVWRVRYFRPQQKEEWLLYVDQRGRLFRTDHILDEKAPGAKLPPDEARRIAETYLTGEQGLPLGRYRLVDSSEEKRDNRVDHGFVWEDREFRRGEATARVSVSVIGDHVSFYRKFLKLPEQWLREFQRPRLQSFLIPALAGAMGMVLLIAFIRRLSGHLGQGIEPHHFHWRAYLAVTAVAALLSVASILNQWPLAMASYNTARPLQDYLGEMLLGRAMGLLLTAVGAFLGVLALDIFLQLAVGHRRLPRPSAVRALAILGLAWGLSRAHAFAVGHLPGNRFSLPLWGIPGADTLAPAITVITGAFSSALALVCIAGAVMFGAAALVTPRKKPPAAVLASALVAAGLGANLLQWGFYFAATLALLALVIFLFRTCAADLITFGVALFWAEALPDAWHLISQPEAFLRWNGIAALVVVAALPAAVAAIRLSRER